MKTVLLSFCLLTSTALSGQTNDTMVKKLLDEVRFFELREALHSGQVPENEALYAAAFLANAFGQEEQSLEMAAQLLENETDPEKKVELMALQASNYSRLYRYAASARMLRSLLKDTAMVATLSEKDHADHRQTLSMMEALSDIEPVRIRHKKDTQVPVRWHDMGHILVPVSMPDKSNVDFIFDTGAGFSVVSESTAQRMGITVIGEPVEVGTSSDIKIHTSYGVADSLCFGEVVVENVVFLILPDHMLYIEPLDYRMDGIIGFPVIRELGELELDQNGTMYIHEQPRYATRQNLFLDGSMPLVEVQTGGRSLQMIFDTGAVNTLLTANYFTNNDQLKDYPEITVGRGGAGGVREARAHVIPELEISVGGQLVKLESVNGFPDASEIAENRDGFLGQDVTRRYDRMVINLQGMYFLLHNKEETK